MEKLAGKPLKDCTPLERAEVLYGVIRTGGAYGISYESSEEKIRKPYTAQEVLENKKGDCDELSRLFIAIENKLVEYGKKNNIDLSLGDIKLLLVEFHTGKEVVGHISVLIFQDEFHFFDLTFVQYNGLGLPKKYLSSEEMINDKEFVSKLEGIWNEAKGEKETYKIIEPLFVLPGEKAHAIYYAELGYYYLNFYNDYKEEKGKWEEVKVNYSIAIQEGMTTYWNYFNLGIACVNLAELGSDVKVNLELAEWNFRKAIDIRPEEYKAHYNLGYVYMKEEKYDEAIESFTTSLKINENNITARYLRGKASHMSGIKNFGKKRYDAALDLFLNAIADYSVVYMQTLKEEVRLNLCNAYYNAALSSYRGGDISRAKEIINEAKIMGFSSENLEELEKAIWNTSK